MPSVVAVVDTGVPVFEDREIVITRKEHVEVMRLSLQELRRAVREGRVQELVNAAAEKLKGVKVLGIYFKAPYLHRLGLSGRLYRPDGAVPPILVEGE